MCFPVPGWVSHVPKNMHAGKWMDISIWGPRAVPQSRGTFLFRLECIPCWEPRFFVFGLECLGSSIILFSTAQCVQQNFIMSLADTKKKKSSDCIFCSKMQMYLLPPLLFMWYGHESYQRADNMTCASDTSLPPKCECEVECSNNASP